MSPLRTAALLLAPPVAVALALGAPAPTSTGASAHRLTSVSWEDAAPEVGGGTVVVAHAAVAAGPATELVVRVTGGELVALPDACAPSTVIRRRSYLDDARTTLVCLVQGAHAQDVPVEVRAAEASTAGQATVTLAVDEHGTVLVAPDRPLVPGPPDTTRSARLISSPDFLNADVGDLRRGPGSWNPRRSANSTSPGYEKAIDTVLDDWETKAPDAVLVAGDLVDGRWGRDTHHTGNFGPVGNAAQRSQAAREAAATYYPQYVGRFRSHHLPLYAAPGDHEYGDNPWTPSKRRLAPVFRQSFAHWLTHTRKGEPRFVDHPRGPHAGTAYAFRPAPDVQVVSLDLFDITTKQARIRVDKTQQHWLVKVLKRAQQDGVRWTIVQGHVPILEPVRARGSSELRYPGGSTSKLWRIFEQYGVDLYLCGEVHDTTATDQDGILQLAHGGAFQFALTTYAVLDAHPDRLDITLDDYAVRVRDARDHSRLWETVRSGLRRWIRVRPAPFTIGTLTLGADGTLSHRSGILLPYRGGG